MRGTPKKCLPLILLWTTVERVSVWHTYRCLCQRWRLPRVSVMVVRLVIPVQSCQLHSYSDCLLLNRMWSWWVLPSCGSAPRLVCARILLADCHVWTCVPASILWWPSHNPYSCLALIVLVWVWFGWWWRRWIWSWWLFGVLLPSPTILSADSSEICYSRTRLIFWWVLLRRCTRSCQPHSWQLTALASAHSRALLPLCERGIMPWCTTWWCNSKTREGIESWQWLAIFKLS